MFNKKSMGLEWYILIIGLLVSIGILFYSIGSVDIPKVGDYSLSLIYSSLEAEKVLFYIDQSAKYSFYQAIYDLAKKGGCNNGEIYRGFTSWDVEYSVSRRCYPNAESAKNNFLEIFPDNLNNRLTRYLIYRPTRYESVKLPLDNYDLEFDNNDLIGLAREPVIIPIIPIKDESEAFGNYSVEPSFKVSMGDYDFSDYDVLRERAESLVKKCKRRPAVSPEKCVRKNIDIFNFESGRLKLEVCELGGGKQYIWLAHDTKPVPPFYTKHYQIYGFCVNNTNIKFYVYDEEDGKVDSRNIVYKFALKIQDLKCGWTANTFAKCKLKACNAYEECSFTDECYCDRGSSCTGLCKIEKEE